LILANRHSTKNGVDVVIVANVDIIISIIVIYIVVVNTVIVRVVIVIIVTVVVIDMITINNISQQINMA
jgi:hypothetical protein